MWREDQLSVDEERAVATFMRALAAHEPGEMQLPDAGTLWRKAQLVREWDALRRAQAPLDVMEMVQVASGAAAAGFFTAWSLLTLQNLLAFIPQ
jgi:hypothetical protein